MHPIDQLKSIAKDCNLELNDSRFATEMDKRDELGSFRERFLFPIHTTDSGVSKPYLYFTGNSLGLQPKTTRKYVEEELDVWEKCGVEGHFNHPAKRPWLTTDEYVLEQMAKIVGANKEEVAVMNSLTVNLHLMMVPFYRPTQQRNKILIEYGAFPSDLYAVQSQIKFHGYDPSVSLIQLMPREGEYTLRTEDIIKCIQENKDSLALVMLSGVQYYTGQFFELEKITKEAHSIGSVVGFDLAHAVGNIPVKLHDWDVDFACWCSYKYLNSGPGNIGGLFVHARHANDQSLPRFAGWWGHDLKTRFQMDEKVFQPIPGAFGFRLSNPPVLCVAALLASVEIFDAAGMERLRRKSELLTGYLEYLVDNELSKDHVKIITPREPDQRGCQLSLLFSRDVTELSKKLLESGVICDVRKPNVIRIAPTPLYNSFSDLVSFISIIKPLL